MHSFMIITCMYNICTEFVLLDQSWNHAVNLTIIIVLLHSM